MVILQKLYSQFCLRYVNARIITNNIFSIKAVNRNHPDENLYTFSEA